MFSAVSFSVILPSQTSDWGPLDGSLARWPCQPQDVPGRDAVRLWDLLPQRKTRLSLWTEVVSVSYFQIVSFQSFSVQLIFWSFLSQSRLTETKIPSTPERSR